MVEIKGNNGILEFVAIISTICAIVGWIIGIGSLIEESFRRRRERRETGWPESEKVTDTSYPLLISIEHEISFHVDRPIFSNTQTIHETFKLFPLNVKTVAASPGLNYVEKEFVCPECNSRVLLVATQRACVILTPEDFASQQHGHDLRNNFMKQRMMIAGAWSAFILLLPALAIAYCISDFSAFVRIWIVAAAIIVMAITVGISAFIHRKGPAKSALFFVKGSQSVLWRKLDHNRFINLIKYIRIAADERSGHSVGYEGKRCGNNFSLSENEVQRIYKLQFDCSYVL